MRLVGRTFESNQARTDEEASKIFDQIIQEATRRLAGLGPGEAEERDELRDRLLGGFRWVLVDEYQDIKRAEYELISALTGQDRGGGGPAQYLRRGGRRTRTYTRSAAPPPSTSGASRRTTRPTSPT